MPSLDAAAPPDPPARVAQHVGAAAEHSAVEVPRQACYWVHTGRCSSTLRAPRPAAREGDGDVLLGGAIAEGRSQLGLRLLRCWIRLPSPRPCASLGLAGHVPERFSSSCEIAARYSAGEVVRGRGRCSAERPDARGPLHCQIRHWLVLRARFWRACRPEAEVRIELRYEKFRYPPNSGRLMVPNGWSARGCRSIYLASAASLARHLASVCCFAAWRTRLGDPYWGVFGTLRSVAGQSVHQSCAQAAGWK